MNTPTQSDPVMAKAKRWVGSLPREQFDLLIAIIREREAAAIRATTEAAASFVNRMHGPGTAQRIETALRANHHLKGSDDV